MNTRRFVGARPARDPARTLVLSLALWLCELSCAHALSLEELGTRLRAQGPFRAELVQEKHLAALQRPLLAHGSISFAPGVGLLYELQQPLAARYAMSAGRVIVHEEGVPVRELRTQDLPWLQAITSVFLATLGGEWEELQRWFDIELQGEGAQWQLRLVPREAALANVMREVRVAGAEQVQRIELDDRNGDRTRITLQAGVPIAEQDLRRALDAR